MSFPEIFSSYIGKHVCLSLVLFYFILFYFLPGVTYSKIQSNIILFLRLFLIFRSLIDLECIFFWCVCLVCEGGLGSFPSFLPNNLLNILFFLHYLTCWVEHSCPLSTHVGLSGNSILGHLPVCLFLRQYPSALIIVAFRIC